MNEIDSFIARTQRQLAFLLIWILVLLVVIVCAILLIPTLHINDQVNGLLIQVVTGVLALAGTAIGFFFARHRPPSASDDQPQSGGQTGPLVQSPEKSK